MPLRDRLMTTGILSFFASAWFGWAQEDPPSSWPVPLTIGACLGILGAVVCGLLAARHWRSGSVLDDRATFRRYLVVVGVECVLCGIGGGLLGGLSAVAYISAWICLVVGVHFVPLARVLRNPGLYPLAIAMIVIAVACVPVARAAGLTTSAVCGAAAGVALLAYAVSSAVALATRPAAPAA